MKAMAKILMVIGIVLGFAGMAGAAPVNSNSKVEDGMEYYIQTDKAVYIWSEHVQMLYRVTNFTEEDVTFTLGQRPVWNFWVEKDGEYIWRAVNAWQYGIETLTLGPGESREFPTISTPFIWDMKDNENNLVDAGEYSAIGGFYNPAGYYEHTKVAVPIEIIPAPATTYYIDAVDGNDNNDGLSPETAFATIQKGIDSAFDGDTVLVTDGTYTGPGNRDIDFLGKAITVSSENGPNNCIIDCQDSHYSAFYFHNGENENSVLEGFTITNGLEPSGYSAIHCEGSSPTITNCIITNSAGGLPPYGGGGIFCEWQSSPTITNCTISDNIGGISCRDDSSPTITNCNITGNESEGIVCGDNSNPKVTNCTINANDGAGGIICIRSSPVITNCIISSNSGWKGGGIYCLRSSPVITNCTITGNRASDKGGGVHCHVSNPTITNCILWANEALNGPQIYVDYRSTATVTYTDAQGGQAAVLVDPGGTLNWDQGNINIDPCFVQPGYWVDANEPNIIVEPNDPNAVWVEGDYHLLRTSPCIDAASDANVYSDIEGNVRPFDFPGVDNNGELPEFDMGAYELVPVEAEMMFTPQMLNCNSKGKWVKAHLTLPEGFSPQDVDVNELATAYPMGTESEYIKVLGSGKGPVGLEIAFDREAFCGLLTEDGSLEITVIGSLTTSQYFYATDTIVVKP